MGNIEKMVKLEIPFAQPIFGQEEKDAVNRVMEGHWLASGKENEAFEREFADYIGVPYGVCVNSGSSANLLALASLDLAPGSSVITSACGFPATLSPILHLGLCPVLVDYDLETHNIDVVQIQEQLNTQDISAILFAHTLGVPVGLNGLEYDCRIIEDGCEAVGSNIGLKDIGTYSFYPSHQITALGGGGMVTCKDEKTFKRLRSLRDWGKMSNWDSYGQNNTSYSMEVDGVPYFPHYVYETVGYNMKLPEANCAFGREQLKRLNGFVAKRKEIHDKIADAVYQDKRLVKHKVPEGALPSWFGVVLTLREGNRDVLGNYLESVGIRHRPFFAGNITRHHPFSKYKQDFPVADFLMRQSLFVGCWPGITDMDIEYMIEHIGYGIHMACKG
ncbi:MAG: DegT/DnrJ/EryC1/StrS family aminotransferase [Nitrospinae bacterium]|nr:DegT/DnrJ/EryC1/StrS family aminotransferase [Nitrospinota bacterium]